MVDLIPSQKEIALEIAGKQANKKAAARTFVDFRSRKAENTLRRYDADLTKFAEFLTGKLDQYIDGLSELAESWRFITWGLVDEFTRWQLAEGYAVSTVNQRLSAVKVFAKLALRAGTLDPTEYAMIKTLSGYRSAEAHSVDEKRRKAGMDTRTGTKKSEPVFLNPNQVSALLDQPDTPQGHRDRLMLALAFRHGLRVSELAILQRGDFDLENGRLKFYRPKINEWHKHTLEPDVLEAARIYLEQDAPETGNIWKTSKKGRPSLGRQGISVRGINKRFKLLGKKIGIDRLSPHDARHTGATMKAEDVRDKDKEFSLLDFKNWGGWKSLSTALGYVQAAEIEYEGQ